MLWPIELWNGYAFEAYDCRKELKKSSRISQARHRGMNTLARSETQRFCRRQPYPA